MPLGSGVARDHVRLLLDDLDARGLGIAGDVFEAQLLAVRGHRLQDDHRDLVVFRVEPPMHDDSRRPEDGFAHQHTCHEGIGCSLLHGYKISN